MGEALAYYRAELKKSKPAIDYLKGRACRARSRRATGWDSRPTAGRTWSDLSRLRHAELRTPASSSIRSPARARSRKRSRRYDRFRNRVMFPILDSRGNVIGFGGRVIGEASPSTSTPRDAALREGRELYGLYQARRAIRDANQVIVVEGYMDVVALAQHGVENAVATLGTATTPIHVAKLLRLADNVVFCFDGDAAGRKAAWRALEISLPVLADGKVVSFLFLPPEDDPDSFVRREGKPAFEAAVAGAKPLSQYLFSELASRVDMSSDEGRARFVNEAKPLLSQIVAPALAAMLRRRLGELARLDSAEIDSLLPPARIRACPLAPAARPGAKALLTLGEQAACPAAVAPRAGRDDSGGSSRGLGHEASTLREVLAFFAEDAARNLGQASAYFEGTEHQALISPHWKNLF
jgi:DNA primase